MWCPPPAPINANKKEEFNWWRYFIQREMAQATMWLGNRSFLRQKGRGRERHAPPKRKFCFCSFVFACVLFAGSWNCSNAFAQQNTKNRICTCCSSLGITIHSTEGDAQQIMTHKYTQRKSIPRYEISFSLIYCVPKHKTFSAACHLRRSVIALRLAHLANNKILDIWMEWAQKEQMICGLAVNWYRLPHCNQLHSGWRGLHDNVMSVSITHSNSHSQSSSRISLNILSSMDWN